MIGAEAALKRLCTRCKNHKTAKEFYTNASGRDGLASRCKECHLNDHRLRKYGVTSDEYEFLLAQQGGVCAICQSAETLTRGDRLTKLAVDHDHVTGLVRGLLCARCNTGLGKFKDDVTLLLLAIRYLQDHANVTRFKGAGCALGSDGSLSTGWSCD